MPSPCSRRFACSEGPPAKPDQIALRIILRRPDGALRGVTMGPDGTLR